LLTQLTTVEALKTGLSKVIISFPGKVTCNVV